MAFQETSTLRTPLVIGFGPALLADSGDTTTPGVVVSSPTDVRLRVGPDTLTDPSGGSPLADAALALLAQGFPTVRVVRVGDRGLSGIQKAEALRQGVSRCIVSPEGWAGIVLAGAVWVEDSSDLLQAILDATLALVLPYRMGPVIVPAVVNPSAEHRAASSFPLTQYLPALLSWDTTRYPKFPYAPLAVAVASSSLSLWGAYCGSGSILRWPVDGGERPPVVLPPPRPGEDPGFPYRLRVGSSVYHPMADLAARGIAVLDTGEEGRYRWSPLRVLTEPAGIPPSALLVLASWFAQVEALVEDRLIGRPLTLERQTLFEREVRQSLQQAAASVHALDHQVRFEYDRAEVQVFVKVEFAYAILTFPLRVRLAPAA